MTKLKANPFNYSGSKFRFLPHILKELPKGDHKFLDVFCGGGDVGLNVPYSDVHMNDGCSQLIDIYQEFREIKPPKLVDALEDLCEKYGLTREDKEAYEVLKKDYNTMIRDGEEHNTFLLYLLVCHSFSNNMRFNSIGCFNLPFGKRTFNNSLQDKLVHWGMKLRQKNPLVTNLDYRAIDFNDYTALYADPPYLVTNACYQETSGLGWGEKEENELYKKLLDFSDNGGKFVLSNQLYSKGNCNELLKEFIVRNKFRAMQIKKDTYEHCNYQRKDGKTVELLIMNY